MHEYAINIKFIFWNNVVIVTTFQPLLDLIAIMIFVFDLFEIPNDSKITSTGNKMPLMLANIDNQRELCTVKLVISCIM